MPGYVRIPKSHKIKNKIAYKKNKNSLIQG